MCGIVWGIATFEGSLFLCMEDSKDKVDMSGAFLERSWWGVYVDREGELYLVLMEIVETVSGKNEKQQVGAIFEVKKQAERFAKACAKKWPEFGFYTRRCEVHMDMTGMMM